MKKLLAISLLCWTNQIYASWKLGIPYYNIDECIYTCKFATCSDPYSTTCLNNCSNNDNIKHMKAYDNCIQHNLNCSNIQWDWYKCNYSMPNGHFDTYKYISSCEKNCLTENCLTNCKNKLSQMKECNDCFSNGCPEQPYYCYDFYNTPNISQNELDCEIAKNLLGACKQDANNMELSVTLPVIEKQSVLNALGTKEITITKDSSTKIIDNLDFGSGSNQYGIGTINCVFNKNASSDLEYTKNTPNNNSNTIANEFFNKLIINKKNIKNASCLKLINSKTQEKVKELRNTWTGAYKPQCLTDMYLKSETNN